LLLVFLKHIGLNSASTGLSGPCFQRPDARRQIVLPRQSLPDVDPGAHPAASAMTGTPKGPRLTVAAGLADFHKRFNSLRNQQRCRCEIAHNDRNWLKTPT
jgi:hypothetical protein